jgi:hypothetical protein
MTTINRRIETAAEVAALATEAEGDTIDYKGKVDSTQWWELAKDVAAFANHLGGVIVVGAFERSDGLPDLRGLQPEEATELSLAYERIARDRCRPSPVLTCTRFPSDAGREILVVNVQAHLGLVGAQFYTMRPNQTAGAPPVASAANAWQFPMRIGKDNVPLPLEQAIMFMSSHARRVAILLASIADASRVTLVYRRPEMLSVPASAELRTFSVERNFAQFVVKELMQPVQTVPLDDIESVWSDEEGTWCVRISGFFEDWVSVENKRLTMYVSAPR